MMKDVLNSIHASWHQEEAVERQIGLTIRTSPELRARLDRLAEYSGWSLSHLCESLLEDASHDLCYAIVESDHGGKSEKTKTKHFMELAHGLDENRGESAA